MELHVCGGCHFFVNIKDFEDTVVTVRVQSTEYSRVQSKKNKKKPRNVSRFTEFHTRTFPLFTYGIHYTFIHVKMWIWILSMIRTSATVHCT